MKWEISICLNVTSSTRNDEKAMIAIDFLKGCFDAVIISSVVLLHKLSKLHIVTL